MLTAIISVIASGSSTQIVLAMLLSFSFLKIYGYFNPYKDPEVAILAEMGQYQIFFTFFCALITSEDLLGHSMNFYVGIFLILLNISIGLMTFYFEVTDNLKGLIGF